MISNVRDLKNKPSAQIGKEKQEDFVDDYERRVGFPDE